MSDNSMKNLLTIKVEEKRENFSLRKLRKPGEREKEKVVLLFSSTLLTIPFLASGDLGPWWL
jgi:hypothetical protein